MDHVYLLVVDGAEWEDLVVYLTLDEALEASKKHPTVRVEVFSRTTEKGGLKPTYNYYLNGTLVSGSFIC
jgi:hypothetical protein